MLLHRCTLENNRIIVPVSVSKPDFVNGQLAPNLTNQSEYRALLDTGAQRSAISQSIIADHNLVRVGHMQFAGIHGPQTHSKYWAFFGIWATRTDARLTHFPDERTLFTIEQPFEIVNINNNHNFDLILGFDVLKHFSFQYDGHSREFSLVIQA